MLSRACAGTIGRTAMFALPGSRARRPPGDDKLILPEIGHVVRELQPMTDTMRPIRETIPLDEALALAARRGRRRSTASNASRSATPAAACSPRRSSPPSTCRRSIARRWTATPSRARTRSAPAATSRESSAAIEKVYTGAGRRRRPSAPGECIEIATGAPMPDGADAVVMVEETEKTRRRRTSGSSRRCIRGSTSAAAAADIAAGQPVLAAGDVLNPSRIGALAAIGAADVDVFARPRVAILSTGNEIVEPGQPLGPGQIYDINRFTLSSIIRAHGGVPVTARTVPDNLPDLADGDSTRPLRQTSSSFPAAARSASAI